MSSATAAGSTPQTHEISTGKIQLGEQDYPIYLDDASTTHNGSSVTPNPVSEGFVVGEPKNGHVEEEVVSQPKRAAKIHDFCLGIPFGGLVGFIFSRNPATLTTSVLFGGALLALSTLSLEVWRRGKSSFPFIIGQAGSRKQLILPVSDLQCSPSPSSGINFRPKKIFPKGFNIVISAAMLCFYAFVVISRGNHPPKKLKTSTPVASS